MLQEIETETAPEMTIALIQDESTGTEHLNLTQAITVYPIPVTNELRLQATEVEIQQVHLFDLQGRLLQRFSNVQKIPMHLLPSGTYWLQIFTDKGTISKKIEKVK